MGGEGELSLCGEASESSPGARISSSSLEEPAARPPPLERPLCPWARRLDLPCEPSGVGSEKTALASALRRAACALRMAAASSAALAAVASARPRAWLCLERASAVAPPTFACSRSWICLRTKCSACNCFCCLTVNKSMATRTAPYTRTASAGLTSAAKARPSFRVSTS